MGNYINRKQFTYWSSRYHKSVTVPVGFHSDGATGAIDIPKSKSWWVHDVLCETCVSDDGTPCTNWQASRVLSDILEAEGHTLRSYGWLWSTFLFGGTKIKERNGWW